MLIHILKRLDLSQYFDHFYIVTNLVSKFRLATKCIAFKNIIWASNTTNSDISLSTTMSLVELVSFSCPWEQVEQWAPMCLSKPESKTGTIIVCVVVLRTPFGAFFCIDGFHSSNFIGLSKKIHHLK